MIRQRPGAYMYDVSVPSHQLQHVQVFVEPLTLSGCTSVPINSSRSSCHVRTGHALIQAGVHTLQYGVLSWQWLLKQACVRVPEQHACPDPSLL